MSERVDVDRRGFLQCMAWAGTGLLWSVAGGVPSSRRIGAAPAEAADASPPGGFSFAQISDTHIGFKGEANRDVMATFQAAIARIRALDPKPAFLIHTGDLTHAQKPGALMYICDVHARMGDGELTGTGVEIDADITLKVERSPGFPTCSPVIEKTRHVEDAEEWLTSGQGATWEDAVKLAWTVMVALIADRYETTFEHANLIVGTVGGWYSSWDTVSFWLFHVATAAVGLAAFALFKVFLSQRLMGDGRPEDAALA